MDICTHHGREVACKKGVGPSGRSRHSSSKSRSYRSPPSLPPRCCLHCVARPVACVPAHIPRYPVVCARTRKREKKGEWGRRGREGVWKRRWTNRVVDLSGRARCVYATTPGIDHPQCLGASHLSIPIKIVSRTQN